MTYPYAPPYPVTPPRPPKRLRGPVTLLVVSVVTIGIGILMWVVAAVLFGGAVTSASSAGDEVRGDLAAEVAVPGSTEVELEAGTHTVYALVPSDVRAGPTTTAELPTATTELGGPTGSVPDLDVTVTAEDGRTVVVDEPTFPSTYTDRSTDTDLVEVAEVVVAEPGTYTIGVAPVDGAQPAERAGIGLEASYGDAIGKGLGATVLVFLGFLVGGFGGVLLLVAFIWLLVAALG